MNASTSYFHEYKTLLNFLSLETIAISVLSGKGKGAGGLDLPFNPSQRFPLSERDVIKGAPRR